MEEQKNTQTNKDAQGQWHPMETQMEEAFGISLDRALEIGKLTNVIFEEALEKKKIGFSEETYADAIHGYVEVLEERTDLTRMEKNYLLFVLGDEVGFREGQIRRALRMKRMMSSMFASLGEE